jgi:hypothetical protein
MRTTAIVTALLLLATAALGSTTGSAAPSVEKVSRPTGTPTYEGRDPGDTVDDPFVIDYLPFYGTGDTCPFINDYDACCPYTGSTSPDAVYRYDCPYSCVVTIDLCESLYDTKVYVYENEYVNGGEIACNDDYPGCGPNGYRSWLMVEFTEGNTYYIVVDGYTGACGTYELYVEDYLPCALCEPGGLGETEPYCMDPENDVDNGGCNSEPPVFDYLYPSEEQIYFCGTSGTYYQSYTNFRDTDWYQIDLANESEITFEAHANFPLRIGIVDGREGCENVSAFYSYVDVSPCELAELTETLGPGTWWLWVGPNVFEDVSCGSDYECWLDGYTPVTAVEDASWSTVKALFR